MESLRHIAILKKFEFLHQFSKKQNTIKKNCQLNWTEKFVDEAQQCFAFLPIEPKFKFAAEWSWFLETLLIWVAFNKTLEVKTSVQKRCFNKGIQIIFVQKIQLYHSIELYSSVMISKWNITPTFGGLLRKPEVYAKLYNPILNLVFLASTYLMHPRLVPFNFDYHIQVIVCNSACLTRAGLSESHRFWQTS